MKFNRIRGQGWIPLLAPFDVDIQSLPGPLVAVTGLMGAGKSSFLELLVGGIHRTMPTRGLLTRMAAHGDAFVEVFAQNGHPYMFRQSVNAINGDVTALVCDTSKKPGAEGYELTASGKIPEYLAWLKQNLPPLDVLLASSFSAQRDGGFLDMEPAERRQLILQVRHIAHYEGMISKARKAAEVAASALLVAEARLADLKDILPREEAQAQLETCQAQYDAAEQALALATDQLARGNAAQLVIEQNRRKREALTNAGTQLMRLECNRDDARERIATEKLKLVRLPKLAKAVKEYDEKEAARQLLTVRIQSVLGEYNVHAQQILHAERRTRELQASIVATNQRLATAVANQARRAEIEAAVLQLPIAEKAFRGSGKAVEQARAQLEAVQGERLTAADNRGGQLRGAVINIRDHGDVVDPLNVATVAVKRDDLTLKAISKTSTQVQAARAALVAAENAAGESYVTWQRVKDVAARAAELKRTAASEITERAALVRLEANKVEAAQEKAAAIAARDGSHQLRAELADALEQLQRRLLVLQPAHKEHLELQGTQSTITELEASLGRLLADISKAQLSAKDLEPAGEDPPAADIPALTLAETTADGNSRTALVQLEAARLRFEAAAENEARRLELVATVATSRDDAAQWERTANDIAGVQQMEVDAACPELTANINHLLHSCVGPRWTIKVVTQTPYARKQKEVGREREVCNVIVWDSHLKREIDGKLLSKGQRTLVNTACSLSVTELGCKGLELEESPTIVHDETSGSLDHIERPKFIAMLRMAADRLGADKILFVSHDLELQQLADSRLLITDGHISVAA